MCRPAPSVMNSSSVRPARLDGLGDSRSVISARVMYLIVSMSIALRVSVLAFRCPVALHSGVERALSPTRLIRWLGPHHGPNRPDPASIGARSPYPAIAPRGLRNAGSVGSLRSRSRVLRPAYGVTGVATPTSPVESCVGRAGVGGTPHSGGRMPRSIPGADPDRIVVSTSQCLGWRIAKGRRVEYSGYENYAATGTTPVGRLRSGRLRR